MIIVQLQRDPKKILLVIIPTPIVNPKPYTLSSRAVPVAKYWVLMLKNSFLGRVLWRLF